MTSRRGRLCPELKWINRIWRELNRIWIEDFPGSSAGEESACSAEDPCAIPGSGRFPGEGIGYSLQYSWVSLVAPTVKNLLGMRDTWV